MVDKTQPYLCVGFSRGNSMLQKLILRITGTWGHAYLMFVYPEQYNVVFEARKEEGVVGPVLLEDLPQKNIVREHVSLSLLTETVRMLERKVRLDVGVVPYRKKQLMEHWFFERIGRFFGMSIEPSPDAVTCAEWVARKLDGYYDLRDEVHKTFDEVTPGSAYAKLMRLKRAEEGEDRVDVEEGESKPTERSES